MKNTKHERNYLKTLARGMKVLSFFTPERPELSLSDLADLLDVDSSTASRFTFTLEELGYLDRDDVSKLYRVSPKIFALTVSLSGPRNIRKVSLPIMEELRDLTGETVVLGIKDGFEIVVIEVVETHHSLVPRGWVGGRIPVHCSALGKASMMGISAEKLTWMMENYKFQEFTPKTILDGKKFIQAMEETNQQGWSVNAEEYTKGIISVGAPIFSGGWDAPIGALCIDIPTARLGERQSIPDLSEAVMKAAQKISNLGNFSKLE